jgi:hypothetical protein
MSVFSVRCIRGDGLHRTPDAIISNLLTELPAVLQRGRNELDDKAHGGQVVTMTVRFRPGLLLGQVIKVQESLFGSDWYAKITGIKHTVSNSKLTTELTLMKPTDFFI